MGTGHPSAQDSYQARTPFLTSSLISCSLFLPTFYLSSSFVIPPTSLISTSQSLSCSSLHSPLSFQSLRRQAKLVEGQASVFQAASLDTLTGQEINLVGHEINLKGRDQNFVLNGIKSNQIKWCLPNIVRISTISYTVQVHGDTSQITM